MSNLYPSLYQLCIESRSSVGRNFLTREQQQAQSELRANHVGKEAAGIILPWRERRDMTATGSTSVDLDQGGMTVAATVPELGTALREASELEAMGSRVFEGLSGNATFPRGKAATLLAEWLTENGEASGSAYLFDALNMAPRRIAAYIDVSQQLLQQGPAVEGHLRTELAGAIGVEIQRVAIAGTGASNQPQGILATAGVHEVTGGDNGAAPTAAMLADLEYKVANSSANKRPGWIVSPLVRKKLRLTEHLGAPLWSNDDANRLLGRGAVVTVASPDDLTKGTADSVCSAITHLDFSELFVAFWGSGISVEAIRAGMHNSGKTRLYAAAYVDAGLRSPKAAAAMKDALCA